MLSRPGKIFPSRLTKEKYYDSTHEKRGVALIFNHSTFNHDKMGPRYGTKKDGQALQDVLKKLDFDVRYRPDFTEAEIKRELLQGEN